MPGKLCLSVETAGSAGGRHAQWASGLSQHRTHASNGCFDQLLAVSQGGEGVWASSFLACLLEPFRCDSPCSVYTPARCAAALFLCLALLINVTPFECNFAYLDLPLTLFPGPGAAGHTTPLALTGQPLLQVLSQRITGVLTAHYNGRQSDRQPASCQLGWASTVRIYRRGSAVRQHNSVPHNTVTVRL